MAPPYATGSRTLFSILKEAEILPDTFEFESKVGESQENIIRLKSKTKSTKRQLMHNITKPDEDDNATPIKYYSDVNTLGKSQGRLMIKGVGTIDISDMDTLAIAESFLSILKKRISSGQQELSQDSGIPT